MGFLTSIFGKKDSPPPFHTVRETLFGDMGLEQWPRGDFQADVFPWNSFVQARLRVSERRLDTAMECWHDVVERHGLEPRHTLQAWYFLRHYGHPPPPDVAQEVLGVAVELGLPEGLDFVIAYADDTARYYNDAGVAVEWNRPDGSLDSAIDNLLVGSNEVVLQVGPWQGQRPPPPESGLVRISFLTPGGLHLVEGPIEKLASDALTASVLQQAKELTVALVEKNRVS